MTGSVERIEQDIAKLDKVVEELSRDLYNTYGSYLDLLAKAVRQQLILTSYYVCTQDYPEQFLRLTFSQRQDLQQSLRKLADQAEEELLAQLHLPTVPEPLEAAAPDAAVQNEPFSPDRILVPLPQPSQNAQKTSLQPVHLVGWHQDLEQAIAETLRTVSHAANRLLQQAGILPQKLPDPILEVASKVESAEGTSTPNLVKLVVEAVPQKVGEEGQEEPGEHRVMQIVAIHLRLAEIEFGDTTVTAARTQIRSLLARLKTLGREYQKKQRERAIAEAQAAWRASWIDG
jgi:hypothetical protein